MYNEIPHLVGQRIVGLLYYTFAGPRQSFMNVLGGAKKLFMSSWEMELLVASLITRLCALNRWKSVNSIHKLLL